MTNKEAIERIKKALTYLYICADVKKKDIETWNALAIIEKDLELLDWLIEKMYVAGGLIELKVCPPNNPTILKYHNAIETHDKRFNDYIDRIHQLKYGR